MQLEINKKTQIAWIVETRKPLIDQISLKQQYLLQMSDTIRALEALQEPILQSGEVALIELMKEIDLPAIRRGIQKQRRALENIKKRFTRTTINIGVIGRARQGKSRVLQSLSGLSADVIPDGELGACTGVRSIVSHSPNESYADVYFYTNEELMQTVIVPYYRELALHPIPTSIDQFASSVLPPLSLELQKQVTASAKYGHLKKYHDHINEYRPLLYVSLPQRIQLNDVRQYVAQQTYEGQDIYNHFAVREVKIYCPFPYARDVDQLAFIDLPGLGDTGMGDEERIIKALGEDIDIALLIRKPVPGGDLWSDFDTDLYDKAQCALQDLLPLHQWVFLILNHTKAALGRSDNLKNCLDLESRLASIFTTASGGRAFVESIIVDCSSPDEVNHLILEPVLSYLFDHINKLDRQYVAACTDELDALHQLITNELEKAHDLFKAARETIVDFILFQDLFQGVWTDLTNGLEALVAEQRKRSTSQNPVFAEYFNSRFEKCKTDDGIPTVAAIKERRNVEGAYPDVYNTCLHEMRTRLTYQFVYLDDAFKLSMDEIKYSVAQVFLKQGKLAAITSSEGHTFFQEMVENIQPDLRHLKQVFRVFANYELSYRGFFQYRIRASLNQLVPDRTTVHPKLRPNMSDDAAAAEVYNTLKKVYIDTINALFQELAQYLVEPGIAAFAVVEEFVDQLIRAEGVQREWSRFYRKEQERIWVADFARLHNLVRLQHEWLSCVEKAQQKNALLAQ